jgi:hypothetical protein
MPGSLAAHKLAYSVEEDDDVPYTTTAESFGHLTLNQSLKIHRSQMEVARDRALKEDAPRVSPQKEAYGGPGMDLKVHRWAMEVARDDALKEDAPRRSPSKPEYTGPGMDLKIHKMQIEVDRDAALAINAPRKSPSRPAYSGHAFDPIASKMRIEVERDAALAANEPRRSPSKPLYDGPGLESVLKKHVCRLQREKDELAANGGVVSLQADARASPRKSRLQMEREASVSIESKAQGEMVARRSVLEQQKRQDQLRSMALAAAKTAEEQLNSGALAAHAAGKTPSAQPTPATSEVSTKVRGQKEADVEEGDDALSPRQ